MKPQVEIVAKFGIAVNGQIHAQEVFFPDEETALNTMRQSYDDGEISNYEVLRVVTTKTYEVLDGRDV